jgi:hypothetical protein
MDKLKILLGVVIVFFHAMDQTLKMKSGKQQTRTGSYQFIPF